MDTCLLLTPLGHHAQILFIFFPAGDGNSGCGTLRDDGLCHNYKRKLRTQVQLALPTQLPGLFWALGPFHGLRLTLSPSGQHVSIFPSVQASRQLRPLSMQEPFSFPSTPLPCRGSPLRWSIAINGPFRINIDHYPSVCGQRSPALGLRSTHGASMRIARPHLGVALVIQDGPRPSGWVSGGPGVEGPPV